MKKLIFVFLLPLMVFSRANVTQISGADTIKFYLANYPYADMVGPTNMPALTLRLATDLNALCYKNASGDLYKIFSSDVDSLFVPVGSSSNYINSSLKNDFWQTTQHSGSYVYGITYYQNPIYSLRDTSGDVTDMYDLGFANGYLHGPKLMFNCVGTQLNDSVEYAWIEYARPRGDLTHGVFRMVVANSSLNVLDSFFIYHTLNKTLKIGALNFNVNYLSSDNKFIYTNSSGKLDTTGVKHYGDATIFPGSIWCDSAHSGIGISNLGSGAKATYVAGGGDWSSDYGAYLQLVGNGDQDSTGYALLKAGALDGVRLSGDSIIIHLWDTIDGLSSVKKDLVIHHQGGLGYEDSNTVFLSASRSDNSVLAIQGGKGSSSTYGTIQLGNEESNRIYISADTIGVSGLFLLPYLLIKKSGDVSQLRIESDSNHTNQIVMPKATGSRQWQITHRSNSDENILDFNYYSGSGKKSLKLDTNGNVIAQLLPITSNADTLVIDSAGYFKKFALPGLDSITTVVTPYCSLFDGATYRARAQCFIKKGLETVRIQLPELTGEITASTITTLHFSLPLLTAPASSLSFYPLYPYPMDNGVEKMGWMKDSTSSIIRLYGSTPYGYIEEDATFTMYPCEVHWITN